MIGGTANDGINKDLAERIAIDVDGARIVINHIVVDVDYMRRQRAPATNPGTTGKVHPRRVSFAVCAEADIAQ